MIVALIIIFEILFFLNLTIFWLIFFKSKKNARIKSYYQKFFPIIWTICLISILVLNSNILKFIFIENFSYFQEFGWWFLVLGIIFILIGAKIISMARKIFKVEVIHRNQSKLVKSGPYSLVRHPIYLGWILIFIGLSFVLDSPLAIIYIPFLILFLDIHSLFEEKYILIPNYGDDYLKYKKKIPNRLFSPPYNYILIFVAIVVIYIGFLNFIL